MKQTTDSTSKLPIQREVWYHIIAMFVGVHHKLYLNGELQDVQEGSFKPNIEETIFSGRRILMKNGFFSMEHWTIFGFITER